MPTNGKDDLARILDAYGTSSPFGEGGPSSLDYLALAGYVPGNKFKHVVVNMRGVNGNTLVILGTVKQALRKAGATPMELFLFMGNAMSHDYEHALATVCQWVTVTDQAPESTSDAWSAMVRIASKNKEN